MSQSKTFSEFLVEQNLVSADDLVSILIEQAKTMPTPAETAREQKLLSSEQLLTVFSTQMKMGLDFNSACQSLGLWTPAFTAALTSENDRLRIPVVQILQSTGRVSTEKLVLALDTYLSQNAKPASVLAPVVGAPMAVAPTESLQASAAGEDDHFCEFYTDAMQSKMLSLAKTWDQSELDVTNALIDRVHGLVGAARFAKLGELEELFKNTESNIRALSDCATPLPFPSIEAFRVEMCQAFEKAWVLRGEISGESQLGEVAV